MGGRVPPEKRALQFRERVALNLCGLCSKDRAGGTKTLCAKCAEACCQRETKVKEETIKAYGGCCARCQIWDLDVLTIDHINDDGNIHRKLTKQTRIYRWLRTRGFPSGFQVLCANCNLKKRIIFERDRRMVRKNAGNLL